MRLIRQKEADVVARAAVKLRRQAEVEERNIQMYERAKDERILHEKRRLRYRVAVYNDPEILPRTMKQRRIVASRREAERRALTASRALLQLHSVAEGDVDEGLQ